MKSIVYVFVCLFMSSSLFASDEALQQLFPEKSERDQLEKALKPIWNFHKSQCLSCHGSPMAAGWEAYQAADYDVWKSQVVGKLAYSEWRESGNYVYQLLANDYALYPNTTRMPPGDSVKETQVDMLVSSDSHQKQKLALGTQPLYIDDSGQCFQKSLAKELNLCQSFKNLFELAKSKGEQGWLSIVELARYDVDHWQETPSQELVYKLPKGETVSFYTRVAPDQSSIGFTRTKKNSFKYKPSLLNLLGSEELKPLSGISYDPTFSPDFNLYDGKGFVFGAKSGSGSYAKYYSFYRPGKFLPKRTFYFKNISGYGSVSKLDNADLLPEIWKPFVGNYLIMGKRWRWIIVGVKENTAGETLDFKVLYPEEEKKAAPPICPDLAINNFDKADSVLSPQGQYIALKKNPDKAPVLVRTKDCKVVSTPSLDGIYGGKATFSNDERFMAIHAFGEDGKTFVPDQMANNDLIKKLADGGKVSNIFIYDISNDQLLRVTESNADNKAVNFFPNFNGSGETLYFHRHRKGEKSSEVLKLKNPFMFEEM